MDREMIEWYGCNFETPECESENRKCSECSHAQVMQLPSIKVPDNPTNGDMVKAMFPLIEVKREISSTSDNIVVRDNLFFGTINRFHTDWWNAPYKGVEE